MKSVENAMSYEEYHINGGDVTNAIPVDKKEAFDDEKALEKIKRAEITRLAARKAYTITELMSMGAA